MPQRVAGYDLRPASAPSTTKVCDRNPSPCSAFHEFVQVHPVFAGATPGDFVRGFSLEQIRKFWRLLAIVEQLVQRNLKCPRQFLECFNGWNGVAIFDAGDIATKESRSFLYVSLGELFSSRNCRNRSLITIIAFLTEQDSQT